MKNLSQYILNIILPASKHSSHVGPSAASDAYTTAAGTHTDILEIGSDASIEIGSDTSESGGHVPASGAHADIVEIESDISLEVGTDTEIGIYPCTGLVRRK